MSLLLLAEHILLAMEESTTSLHLLFGSRSDRDGLGSNWSDIVELGWGNTLNLADRIAFTTSLHNPLRKKIIEPTATHGH